MKDLSLKNISPLILIAITIAVIFVFIKVVLPVLNTANTILSAPVKAIKELDRQFNSSLNSMVYDVMYNAAKLKIFNPNNEQDVKDLAAIKASSGLTTTQKNEIIRVWKITGAAKLGMIAGQKSAIQDEINRLVKKIGHDFF